MVCGNDKSKDKNSVRKDRKNGSNELTTADRNEKPLTVGGSWKAGKGLNGYMTDEQQAKRMFAYEWLKDPRNSYAAALKVTQRDIFAAMQIVNNWCHDPEVIQFKLDLVQEHGEEHFLPSKLEMVRDVIDRARDTLCPDAFGKLYKLAADMRGFIEKPGVTINNNTSNNKVMVMPVGRLNRDGSVNEEVWEQAAIEQQNPTVEGSVV